MKRLLILLPFVLSCAPGEFGAGAKMANTILSGVACGMAAANDTPCTPKAVLDSLAKDAAAQETKVKAVAPAAAAVDAKQTQLLLDQMAANTESNRELTKALIALVEKGAASSAPSSSAAPAVTSAPTSSEPPASPEPMPPAAPTSTATP